MKNRKVTFEEFEAKKLSKNEQKTIHGGGENEPIDPSKGTGKGNG
ncbi:rSAM-modified peptide [Flavobacterium sp.]